MKIAVLQLGDIHLKKDGNSVIEKLDRITKRIQGEMLNIDGLYLILSGDVAFSGNQDEYSVAVAAIDRLKIAIREELHLSPVIIPIPGNHDCNYRLGKGEIRNLIIQQIKTNVPITDQLISECCNVQEHYVQFSQNYLPTKNLSFDTELLKVYTFTHDDKKVVINAFNTSWMSEVHEKPGTMIFPWDRYENIVSQHTGDLVISVLHHPLNWFNPINSREIRKFINNYSDVILTGHEHVQGMSKREDFNGQYVEYIEGGVLQESHDPIASAFNLLIFDLGNQRQNLIQYSWSSNEGTYLERTNTGWIELKQSENSTDFRLCEEFGAFLNDPGAALSHPRKQVLTLQDIFIYPDANIIKMNDDTDNVASFINVKDLVNIEDVNKFLIVGDEKSGKTSLCKVLFMMFKESGYVPVYLDGASINRHNIEDIERAIIQAYSRQYSQASLEMFKQLETAKKLIIVDDIDKSKLNTKFTVELMKNISSRYSNVVFTGNSLLAFFDLMHSEGDDDWSVEFRKFELAEFGHALRAELIERWNTIGRLETIDEDELLELNDRTTGIINTVIGSNYVPSYPFFLLVLLQTIESSTTHNLKDSSYGHYYEWLITQSLLEIEIKKDDLDAFYNYVTELAYRFYSAEIFEMSKVELDEFHGWFCGQYALRYDFDDIVKKLVTSVMESGTNVFRFRYKYIYYYFVARYLAHNISQAEIKTTISSMCKKLHIKECANIIMFLTHLSKEPSILEEILEQAKLIFHEVEPTKLEDDVSSINALLTEVPKVVYENIGVKEHRKKHLESQDELDRAQRETATSEVGPLEEEDDIDSLDMMARLNLAFKTLEIIGQILKNYYGSIKGPEKFVLCQEAYNLGLRSLNMLLTTFSENLDSIVNELQRLIEEKDLVERDEVTEFVKKVVYSLCLGITIQFVKKVSASVGTYNLQETFRQVLANQDTVATRLIDSSIKLDHYRMIPYNDIRTLRDKIGNGLLPFNALQRLVLEHLYMFNTDYKDKQRICQLLDISVKEQIKIGLTSTRKKE